MEQLYYIIPSLVIGYFFGHYEGGVKMKKNFHKVLMLKKGYRIISVSYEKIKAHADEDQGDE